MRSSFFAPLIRQNSTKSLSLSGAFAILLVRQAGFSTVFFAPAAHDKPVPRHGEERGMEPEMHELAKLFPNIAAQLRGSLGTLHLAASQLVTAEQREADPELDAKAAVLDQSYYQMLRLVNNLNQAALLRSDKPLRLRDTDLVELLDKLCARAEGLATEIGLTLEFVCREQQLICAADPGAFEQMVYHLLSNAFKFTPAGGKVTVELRLSGKQVLLSVADTGAGIPPEKLETLFDRYLHEIMMDPRPHGLGLGLPLCRRIAEGHGGVLLAESKVGEGSRFTLRMPKRRAEGGGVSDIPLEYSGGFNPTLLALADALPAKAFRLRNQ